MQQEFDPPHYTWTANTAKEAEDIVQAVQGLIDAHMAALIPGDARTRWKSAHTAPVALTVSLDLTGLIERINDQRTLNGLEADLNGGS